MKASSISTEPGQWRGETVNWRKEVIKYCGRSDPIFFLRFSLVICCIHFVVQSLSGVQLFSTPWTAAHQASLSFTTSQNLLKLMSIESVMPSNCLILCHLLLLPSVFLSISSVQLSSVAQSCLTLCNPMNHSTPGLPVCPSPTLGVHSNLSPSSW